MICGNCGSDRHRRCCARCGRLTRRGAEFCSRACESAQERDNDESAAREWQSTTTCPDCRTDCGHEECERCAADGPRPEPATIGAMLLDAEIQRASGAELLAMRDAEQAKVQRFARLAGAALGAGNRQRCIEMAREAIAHGANVQRLEDEIMRRAVAPAEPR